MNIRKHLTILLFFICTLSCYSQSLTKIKDIPSKFLNSIGSMLYFMSDSVLWRSNGTPEGTIPLYNLSPGLRYFSHGYIGMHDVNGIALIRSSIVGKKFSPLFRSDGTKEGTWILIDSLKQFNFLLTHNNIGYFSLRDSLGVYDELWRTDGTIEGTWMIKYFNSPSGKSGIGYHVVVKDNIMYFPANDTIYGNGLWRSDGTGEGTWIVKAMNTSSKDFAIGPLTLNNGRLYFSGYDSIYGPEPWRSDGTPEGTYMIQDVIPGAWGSTPNYINNLAGSLYFIGYPNSTLYKILSDQSVLNVHTFYEDYHIPYLFDNSLGFFMTSEQSPNYTFHRINGESFNELKQMGYDFSPHYAQEINNHIFFGMTLEHSEHWKLWRSDGTAKGTVLFKDLEHGNSIRPDPVLINSILYFRYHGKLCWKSYLHCTEIWRSDLTTEGTYPVTDFNDEGYISEFIAINGIIYFNRGNTLWKLNPDIFTSATTAQITNTDTWSIFPNPSSEGVFKVELNLKEEELKWHVTNIVGVKVSEGKAGTEGNIILDLKGHSQGTYFLTLISGSRTETKKLIIQ
jgi:ELWxxDGT repeat protein